MPERQFPEPDLDRPCLILIPGLLNDADIWREPAAMLSEVLDVRTADITRGSSLAELADQILADAPERFSVAGFSLGGYVAQQIARQAPERLERLALVDTSIRPDSPQRAAERLAQNEAVKASSGHFHGFGDKLMRAYLAPGHADDPAIAHRVREMTQRVGADVFLRQNALDRPDGAEVLSTFPGPVLIACGAHDRITPVAWHEEMASLSPHAVLEIIPDAGHLTPIEAPVALSMAMAHWMARR